MKNLVFSLLVLGLCVLGFSACSKSDDTLPANSNVTTLVQQGTWKITLFNDSGKDELYHFSGYSFAFNSGTVTANKSGSSVSGTYQKGTDDSRAKLIFNFGNASPLDELNEDWEILEESSTKIRLQHISGGNGGTDLLTFERI